MYAWRLEQEAGLRKAKGSGMTDDQVVEFVNGCTINKISSMGVLTQLMMKTDYPAYELYTEPLRALRANLSGIEKITLEIGRERKLKVVHFF